MSSVLRLTSRVALAALLCAGGSQPAAAVVTSSGSSLARRVAEAVEAAAGAGASVHVAEAAGTVVLSGSTTTLRARERAAYAAEAVEGVAFLEVRVVARPGRPHRDAEVEAAVIQALQAVETLGGPAPVDVSVSAGRVTLSGTVHQTADKYALLDAAREVEGAVAVEDAVAVDPQAGMRQVEAQVEAELTSRRLEVIDLTVARDGRTVVINGVAHDVVARHAIDGVLEGMPGGGWVRNAVLVVPRR
jgi:osmotically-inducible protein OsmY